MSIILFGLNHRTAPLEVREKMTFPASTLEESLGRLAGSPFLKEGLILSTCNRTEILGHAPDGARDAAGVVRSFLAAERGVPPEELDRYCYRMADREAVHHLFRVTASLDSMVLGEAQILGQVKEAYQAALRAKSIGAVLDALLRKALGVAKKIRSETGIARHPVSVGYAAVTLARTIFEDLNGRKVLLIGAGKMSELAARHLVERGIGSVLVANRSFPRAVELAAKFAGEAVSFDRILEYLEVTDIVISSTAAPHFIVRYEEVQRLIRARKNRPIFFIDIAVPRDIEPRVNTIDNVFLYDLDDLTGVVDANRAEREAEAKVAEDIVRQEADAFHAWVRTLDISPVIVDVRQRLDDLRNTEMDRFRSKLAGLTLEQRQAVEEMTGSLMNKILHHPIRALKESARTHAGPDRVLFFREVFGIQKGASGPSPAADAAPSEPPVARQDHDDPDAT
jgi:glutamyl-tRNA reductase